MSALATGLGLALVASIGLNGGYLLQHAGSRGAPSISVRRPLATLRGLLRSRWWLAGSALGLLGWGLHIAALSHAPLSLVQAFAAGGLAFVAPVAAFAFRERLTGGERVGVALMVASLAALALGATAGAVPAVPAVQLIAFLAGSAAVAGLLVGWRSTTRRPHLLATAGGVLYGAADAAVKAATVSAHGVLAALLLSPWTIVVVVLSVGGFFCFQRGLQAGAALPAIALMTAATNVVSIGAGLLVLGDPLGATPALAVVHAAAFPLLAVAAWLLAPAQARLAEGPEARAKDHSRPDGHGEDVLRPGEADRAREGDHSGEEGQRGEPGDQIPERTARLEHDSRRKRSHRARPHARYAVVGRVDHVRHLARRDEPEDRHPRVGEHGGTEMGRGGRAPERPGPVTADDRAGGERQAGELWHGGSGDDETARDEGQQLPAGDPRGARGEIRRIGAADVPAQDLDHRHREEVEPRHNRAAISGTPERGDEGLDSMSHAASVEPRGIPAG